LSNKPNKENQINELVENFGTTKPTSTGAKGTTSNQTGYQPDQLKLNNYTSICGHMDTITYISLDQIAKLTGVAPRTVRTWIDKGVLKGQRLPGSSHRKVRTDDYNRFAIQHDYPTTQTEIKQPIAADPTDCSNPTNNLLDCADISYIARLLERSLRESIEEMCNYDIGKCSSILVKEMALSDFDGYEETRLLRKLNPTAAADIRKQMQETLDLSAQTKRTVTQVLDARKLTGCCERYANNMACDCLKEASTKDTA
jgi:excisionase family DNA binding protein